MMVYGPGGYRFMDFLRIGIPMDILCWAIAMATIPWVFPLTAPPCRSPAARARALSAGGPVAQPVLGSPHAFREVDAGS